MEDTQVAWIQQPSKAWSWAMGWVEQAKQGSHHPVKTIRDAATMFRGRWCTDGLWSPGAELVYDMLREAQDMAQDEYEKAQPAIESV